MLLTKPVALKPNSRKWRLPTSWQGLSKLTNGKAHRNAVSAATQYQKLAANTYQGANTALNAKATWRQ
ncbi:hypothetical protein BCT90_20135 [Vibrio lentus]|nr:hypothetical protein BCT90_20135 [Vibrio lentus]